MIALNIGTAQATPVTPRTRVSAVSRIGLLSSTYSTPGSITQMSGRLTSSMKAKVRDISPTKIDGCWVMISAAKVTPMIMPRYLPRSPNSIERAMISIGAARTGSRGKAVRHRPLKVGRFTPGRQTRGRGGRKRLAGPRQSASRSISAPQAASLASSFS